MASDHWGWNEADTILYLGIILAAGGILSCFSFSLIGPLSKRVDERTLLIVAGIFVMMIGRAIMFPFPGADKPPFRGNYTECGAVDPNATIPEYMDWDGVYYGGGVDLSFDDRAGPSIAGCAYCWCLEQPKMTVTQFIIGMAVSMMGYPFCTTLIASLFSKVLGNTPQVRRHRSTTANS
jgi:ceroid-lipofuscinosis MFS transporter 7